MKQRGMLHDPLQTKGECEVVSMIFTQTHPTCELPPYKISAGER
jgi:hypothetical protein